MAPEFASGIGPRASATEDVPVSPAVDSRMRSLTSYGQVTTHGHCESLIEEQEAVQYADRHTDGALAQDLQLGCVRYHQRCRKC